jgi:F-type H+-transporting ATPase subunit O
VEKDLAAFGLLLSKNKDLQTFVTNPTIPRGQAAALMESTFGDKKKTTEVAKNLFVTLAANARLADASKVIEAYVQLMKARRGEVDAVVTTAEPLTAAQQKTVAAALKAKAGAGNVLLETKVDPSLIGGLTVQIGDQFTDLSLRAKIARTKEILNSA